MAKEIKITLLQELIFNSVKNETFHRGQITKAADGKNTVVAFHEQAGDDEYHMAMIKRAMFSQAEKLKTWFSDYLSGNGMLAEDPLISSDEKNGQIDIILKVSDRFNDGYVKTLARLSQKYVEDRIIHLWWVSSNADLSKMYAQIAEDDLQGILRCFAKKAPTAPVYHFPTAINIHYPLIRDNDDAPGYITPDNSPVVDVMQLFNNPWVMRKGSDTEISYTLTGEDGNMPIDDIVVRCDNPHCCSACISDGMWSIKGIHPGITTVTLFSRHNDQVFAKFAVQVTD